MSLYLNGAKRNNEPVIRINPFMSDIGGFTISDLKLIPFKGGIFISVSDFNNLDKYITALENTEQDYLRVLDIIDTQDKLILNLYGILSIKNEIDINNEEIAKNVKRLKVRNGFKIFGITGGVGVACFLVGFVVGVVRN
jgi:hypothetical protein